MKKFTVSSLAARRPPTSISISAPHLPKPPACLSRVNTNYASNPRMLFRAVRMFLLLLISSKRKAVVALRANLFGLTARTPGPGNSL
jgi:hypothetical protein